MNNSATASDLYGKVLTPESFAMLDAIATQGGFAAAARALDLVPSALSYRVRQLEETLDVLLFDRRSRNAKLTPAGAELLREGRRMLADVAAIAERVKRVATGWEPVLTIAVDSLISRKVVFELCQAFFELKAPTRLRLRGETLSGTWQALTTGKADIALGGAFETGSIASTQLAGIQVKALGDMPFVFAVAPRHPLAKRPEPLSDEEIAQHRVVAVADSTLRGDGLSVNLLAGQDVFTVPSMQAKLDAHLRGLGCGFLPLHLAQPYVDAGELVAKTVQQRALRVARTSYAWRSQPRGAQGHALTWWLQALDSPRTRRALIEDQAGGGF
jgi:DNA-binding transcriptional LysR family regulator